jgi:hypothetical protein
MCELAKLISHKEKRSVCNPYFIGQFNPEPIVSIQSQLPENYIECWPCFQYEPFHLAG